MKRTRDPEPSATGITQAANSMAVTVSGVYLATHSVMVTALATGASTLLFPRLGDVGLPGALGVARR